MPVQASTPSSGVVRIDAVPASDVRSTGRGRGGGRRNRPARRAAASLAAFVGGIAVSHIGVTVDASAHGHAAEITVAADQPWSVLPGHFDVGDLMSRSATPGPVTPTPSR